MPNYNQNAIEGHIYCWQLQRKPPKFSHAGLLKFTGTEVWTLEDIESFYKKIDNGQYTLQGDDAIKGFIYCLYRQRLPCKAAHAKISKVLGQDEIKLEDVQEIYQMIENGYNMEKISLEGIMKLMNQKIVNELDLKSRISLRNTSKALRTLIDNGSYKMELLRIKIAKESILIEDFEYGCSFHKKSNKCEIFDNENYKLVKGAHWKRAEKGLKLLLGANNNMQIERLELEALESFEPKLTFVDVLGSLDKKLKVKTLYCHTPNYNIMYHIADLLNCLDPHELEELIVPCYLPGFFACQIFGTEHWKNLKSFECYSNVYYNNLGDTFGHLNFAHFRPLRSPTVVQLVQLKDSLLPNQNLEAIILTVQMERASMEVNDLRSHFDQIADFKTPFHVAPTTDQKILSVFIDSSVIAFKGPCCVVSVSGDTAMLEGTRSEFYETLQRERNDDSKWYHFYY